MLTLDDETIRLIIALVDDFQVKFGRVPTALEVRAALLQRGG